MCKICASVSMNEWMKTTSIDQDASVLKIFSLKIFSIFRTQMPSHECIYFFFFIYSCELCNSGTLFSCRYGVYTYSVAPFSSSLNTIGMCSFLICTARFHFKSHWDAPVCACARAALSLYHSIFAAVIGIFEKRKSKRIKLRENVKCVSEKYVSVALCDAQLYHTSFSVHNNSFAIKPKACGTLNNIFSAVKMKCKSNEGKT